MWYIKQKGIELFKKADVIINGSRPWDIKVHNDKFYTRLLLNGSICLSAKQITAAIEELFYVVDWHDFTQHYHRTMLEWYKNFDKNWSKLKNKYDERFYRLWKYYLLCCPGTALAKTHHLWQVVFAKIDSDIQYERISE